MSRVPICVCNKESFLEFSDMWLKVFQRMVAIWVSMSCQFRANMALSRLLIVLKIPNTNLTRLLNLS